MRIGSLFTGYGGLDLAVQQVMGGDIAWTVENDPAARRVLAARHPGTPNHGDITRIDWTRVEPVDAITAGYPCQPFSVAGQRRGTDDERHLWPHVAAAVRVLRPRWLLLENVPGHLRLGFDAVLADLAALGFDAEWAVVRASDVGAPHRRERLFVLAWDADRAGLEGRPSPARHADQRPAGADGVVAADPARELLHRGGDAGQGRRGEPADRSEQPVTLAQLLPTPIEAQRLLPTPNASDGPKSGPGRDLPNRIDKGSQLNLEDRIRGLQEVAGIGAFGPYQAAIDCWSMILGREAPPPTETGRDGRPRLSPRFVEWMMGLPNGWVTATPRTTRSQALKILGNGVVPQQAAHALQILDG